MAYDTTGPAAPTTARSARPDAPPHATVPRAPREFHLLERRDFRVVATADVEPLVARWVPRVPTDTASPAPHAARLHVAGRASGAADDARPDAPPDFTIGDVSGWVDRETGATRLHTVRGEASAALDPAARTGQVWIADAAPAPTAENAIQGVLAVASALLMLRLGGYLAHAGAIVAPDGGAWLLVGDSHAGKTTTCLNLIRAGWDYLSDDNVVLFVDDASATVEVEGWPRLFHLDTGWTTGTPHGRRVRVDPAPFGPGRWRRSAHLAGALFPRVEADAPTALRPLAPADALAGLLRQSPWVLTDRRRAPAILAALSTVARLPAHALRLGLDSYRDPAPLLRCLAPLHA